jgi:hypothetical protein
MEENERQAISSAHFSHLLLSSSPTPLASPLPPSLPPSLCAACLVQPLTPSLLQNPLRSLSLTIVRAIR